MPRTEKEQKALAEQIGQDGKYLRTQIYHESSPEYLRLLPAVEVMRRIWIQNYYQEGEHIQLRDEKDYPPAQVRIISPYDEEARFSTKREVYWHGYKAHLTETCEEETPHRYRIDKVSQAA